MSQRCPLCDGTDLTVFLERPGVPVHQNLPLDSRTAAVAAPRGDLRIACCGNCGFVTNTAFRQELLQYGERYENDQTFSPHFDAYVSTLVQGLVHEGIRDKLVVEVGCGRGQFLRRLCEQGGNRGVGFDPSYQGPELVDDGRVRFVREYYGRMHAHVRPDFVVCRHVIEHVPEPLLLLEAVRAALDGAAHAELAFETPTVEWILEGVVVQDFFYEHCSYFTEESLAFAFRRAGFSPRDVRRVFGEQYIWLRAMFGQGGGGGGGARPNSPGRVLDAVARFQGAERKRTEALQDWLVALRREGPVAVWGAGAKGVTFLHLLDANGRLVDCVVDINRRKQGKFVPGTGHPIVGIDDLSPRSIRSAVVMNANYVEEIKAATSAAGLNVAIYTEADAI